MTRTDILSTIDLLKRELNLKNRNLSALFETVTNQRDLDRYLASREELAHRIDALEKELQT
jgi:hypothetical protein